MNAFALTFLVVNAVAVFALPRRWAPVPLLATCCYMTTGQGVEIGPISLPIYRLVLAAGLLRVIIRREAIVGGVNTVDKLMVVWAIWMMLASFFHQWAPGSGPVYAAGFVFNIGAVYVLTRVMCGDMAEIGDLICILAFLLVPVALAMLTEHIYKTNIFGIFGGVTEYVYIRDGKIRAQGPFSHPILAGTVGAVCMPLMAGIWRSNRLSALVGIAACGVIVLASTSSGPLMSLIFAVAALMLYPVRHRVWVVRWAAVAAYVSASILMTRPAYYLMSKFDLTGSSTGWHRARLIEAAMEHLSEWWAFGTDYTGHWMPYTLEGGKGQHSDITNYYLFVGTIGGLPAMFLLIAIIWRSFVWVGECVRSESVEFESRRFMMWCFGAGLFAHATTSLSVAYFDQSMMFFWLNVGAISSMYSFVIHSVRSSASLSESAKTITLARARSRRHYQVPRPRSNDNDPRRRSRA